MDIDESLSHRSKLVSCKSTQV